MKNYRIVIVVSIPNEVSDKQVAEWAEFSTGYTAYLQENNPIYEQHGSDIEAISCKVSKCKVSKRFSNL